MNRLNKLIGEKKNLLSIYFTAGFPGINDTLPILEALQNAEIDFVEIGIPFSDPLADGPVIQASSSTALKNGMSISKLFEQLHNVRKTINIPLVMMGYFNPIMKFGIENFLKKCSQLEIDGLIIPDLPFEIFNEMYKHQFKNAGVNNIFLITPQTPSHRIRLLDENSTAFLYMVSSAGVTGGETNMGQKHTTYFERIKDMNLKSPLIIGFGINNNENYRRVCKYANGAIVGSAFIKTIERSENLKNDIPIFVKSIKETQVNNKTTIKT